MKTFTTVWKKLEKWIFTDQFRQKYSIPRAKSIFVIYCFIGGFWFDQNVRNGFKKLWIIFNILSVFVVSVSCLYYWIHAPISDYYTLLVPIPAVQGLFSKIIIYTGTFLSKDEFVKLIDFLHCAERPITEKNEQKYSSFCTPNLKKPKARTIVVLSFFLIICLKEFNLHSFIELNGYFVYMYPTYAPFDLDSLQGIFIQIMQIITVLPDITLAISFPLLAYAIHIGIYNRFELLSLYLRDSSYSLVRCIDEITNLEMAMEEKRIPSSLSKIHELKIKKALALDVFLGDMIVVIKRHQELYAIGKLYAKAVGSTFVVTYWGFLIVTVNTAFFISMIMETKNYLQLSMIGLLVSSIILSWYVDCFIGETLQAMNQMISSEIYECPWYLLEPKDRKIILIFLTITQRPITIIALWIYPVNLAFFPITLNTMYSQVKILRTLQIKKQKHQ